MFCRSQIAVVLAIALGLVVALPAQTPRGTLNGHIEENQYVSPTGIFRIKIPVIAALGGSITDTDHVVTFQDSLNTHQSIACFKLDATQQREDEARGRKEYLIWFLANFVQADFEQRFPGARVESAQFLPDLQNGTLLAYNLLPGGSMFAHRTVLLRGSPPPVAKRGNLLFVNNGAIYILSIELAEKVIEGASYKLSTEEEDAELRKRLMDLLNKITFNAPAATKAQPATTPTTAKPAP